MCLAVMLIVVILTKIPLSIAMAKQGKGYDNRTPRQQQATLTGWGARALAAHQNSFEDLIFFTPAVAIVMLSNRPELLDLAGTLALVHVAARVLFPILYLANIHLLRSAVWGVGFACSVWMAFLPILN